MHRRSSDSLSHRCTLMALSWYQWMYNNKLLHSWQHFTRDLLRRFGPSPYQDLQGELAKIQQITAVQEYYNRFEELPNSGIPMSFLQSCFESGLSMEIRREVRALQPQSLLQAYQLAKLMEAKLMIMD